MKTKSFGIVMGLFVSVCCARAAEPAALKAELIKTEAEFFDFALAHGFSEAVHAYIADDGFVANSLTLGRDAQGERMKAEATKPPRHADAIKWRPLRAEVAAAGDMGYTWGIAESAPTKDGPFKPYGVYVTIWKRQADGKWKFVYDTATILSADRIEGFLREHFPAPAAATPERGAKKQ